MAAVIVSLPVVSAEGQTSRETGLAIAAEADRRDTGFGDSTARVLMILRDRGGNEKTRELRAQVLEGAEDGDKNLVVFDSPADVKGTALLTYAHKQGDDDQWLYLPALKRVKRIAASNKSGPFMGSEFSYEDLASEEVEKYTYEWLRDEACPVNDYRELGCFVVERRPTDDDSGYRRQTVWMDQDEYRVLKIDYYDRKDEFLKTLTLTGYRQHLEQYWRAHRLTMVNEQSGRRTDLIWREYQFRAGLTDNDFTPRALARAR
jgi:outer membrane lipoprotein-sorting protein